MKNKKSIVIIAMCVAVLFMTVVFAALQTRLTISGIGTATGSWKIEIDDIVSTPSGTAYNIQEPVYGGTNATVYTGLKKPGDKMTYTITVANNGTINAIIDEVNIVQKDSEHTIYTITGLQQDVKLGKGKSITFDLVIEFDRNMTYIPEDGSGEIEIEINCIQDNNQELNPSDPNYEIINKENTLAFKVLNDNTPIDGNALSGTTVAGLYYTNVNTENNKNTYYFSGDVTNNYVKFGPKYTNTCKYNGYDVQFYHSSSGNSYDATKTGISEIQCLETNVCDMGNNNYAVGLEDWRCTGNGGTYLSGKATFKSEVDSNDNMIWRIVRINEDGSIRLIAQDNIGGSEFSECCQNLHIGYMYGDENSQVYDEHHANLHDSPAKIYLDNWYDKYLSQYAHVMADAGFCGDREVSSGTGLGLDETYYAATSQFKCSNSNRDLYTLTNSAKGNKALTRPIGLITYSELVRAGKYINNGTLFYSMTPSSYDYMYASPNVYGMNVDGSLVELGNYTISVEYGLPGIRPVINVKGAVEVESGNGTKGSPYVIKTTQQSDSTQYLTTQVLSNNKLLSDSNINFGLKSSDTNGKGLYYTNTNTENNMTTYYFRGAVENNYVKFANYYWRIVRINEDGSTRLIYYGTTPAEGGADASIGTSVFNQYSTADNTYAGYMFGSAGASSYSAAHANTNDSTIKKVLDNWYVSNLSNYSSYLADAGFCNDRSLYYGTGAGQSSTGYNGYPRLFSKKAPQFACPQTTDLFTTKTSTKGNKALNYPIGLLTGDELMYAGAQYNVANNEFYLASSKGTFWTMTPFDYTYNPTLWVHTPSTTVFYSANSGVNVRPVINLQSNVSISGGTGTVSDPYIIK